MNLGRIKFRIARLQSYGAPVVAVVNILTFLAVKDLPWWFVLFGIPPAYLLHILDKHKVNPHESATAFNDNLEWQDMKRKVDELHAWRFHPKVNEYD